MSKFLNPKFYKKWSKDFYKMFRVLPYKSEFFAIPFVALGLKKGTITFSKQHKHISYPSKRFLDAVCVYSEIFSNEDYKVGETILNSTIIDCGANFGFATVYFKLMHPENHFFVIEPDSENFDILKENITNIFPDIKAEFLKIAISNDNEGVQIMDSSKAPSLKQFMPSQESQDTSTVIPSLSLNQLVEKYNIPSIGILKIDIEGAEKFIFEKFETMENAVAITRYLIIETHDEFEPGTMELVENKLTSRGFVLQSRKFHEFAKTTIDLYHRGD